MHASLDWLTAEAGPVRIVNDIQPAPLSRLLAFQYRLTGQNYSAPWKWEQRTIINVGGMLPMVAIGHTYYWEENASPVTALHTFRPQSCRWLEGIVDFTNSVSTVLAGKAALERLQVLTSEAVDLALEESSLALLGLNNHTISNRVAEIQKSISDLTLQIRREESILSSNLNQGGVIVFRWHRSMNREDRMRAGDYAKVEIQSANAESGFSILAGIKVATLRLDNSWIENNRTISSRLGFKSPRNVGVVTYLLQAKHAVYVRDLESLQAFLVEADLSKLIKGVFGNELTIHTAEQLKIALRIYRATVSRLTTFGAITDIHWKEHDYGASGLAAATSGLPAVEVTNAWSTVYAVLTHPMGLTFERPLKKPIPSGWLGTRSEKPALQRRQRMLSEGIARIGNCVTVLRESGPGTNDMNAAVAYCRAAIFGDCTINVFTADEWSNAEALAANFATVGTEEMWQIMCTNLPSKLGQKIKVRTEQRKKDSPILTSSLKCDLAEEVNKMIRRNGSIVTNDHKNLRPEGKYILLKQNSGSRLTRMDQARLNRLLFEDVCCLKIEPKMEEADASFTIGNPSVKSIWQVLTQIEQEFGLDLGDVRRVFSEINSHIREGQHFSRLDIGERQSFVDQLESCRDQLLRYWVPYQ